MYNIKLGCVLVTQNATVMWQEEGSMNAIPFLGWGLSLLFNISMAIPFWIVWTQCGIGVKFFSFLPEVYQTISFWNCVGLFIAVEIIKSVFVPKIASVTQNNKEED